MAQRTFRVVSALAGMTSDVTGIRLKGLGYWSCAGYVQNDKMPVLLCHFPVKKKARHRGSARPESRIKNLISVPASLFYNRKSFNVVAFTDHNKIHAFFYTSQLHRKLLKFS